VLLSTSIGAGVMSLIMRSSLVEGAKAAAWSEVVLRSFGAKSPKLDQAMASPGEVQPTWAPVPIDGWDDGDLPASQRELVLEQSTALVGITNDEWLDSMRRSAMGSGLSPYDSADYLNLAGHVLRGGYRPQNPAIYLASWVYVLTALSTATEGPAGEAPLDMGLLMSGKRSGRSLTMEAPNSRLMNRSREAVEKGRKRPVGGMFPEALLSTIAARLAAAMAPSPEAGPEDEVEEMTPEEAARLEEIADRAFLFFEQASAVATGELATAEEE